jgi:alanyl-tRNA synthetase
VTFSTVVADIREEGRTDGRQRWQLLLKQAGFAPGDRGTIEAVARSGARLVIPVLGVIEDRGEIWLRVEKPLMAGAEVTAHVESRSRARKD